MKRLAGSLPELVAIERLSGELTRWGTVDVIAIVDSKPIHAIRVGASSPTAPALLVTAGVHGVEQIGTHVALALLTTLVARLGWDEVLHAALERVRLVIVPLVNPVGMAAGTRANGNGVDLMRNAPPAPFGGTPLVGGQRISPRLPWYMGRPGEMEPEARALCQVVASELFDRPFSIALDLHSGFGMIDRLWYPYARTREPLPDLHAIRALERLLAETLPNHVYKVEQTAQVYTIRGDLWDHLYDARRAVGAGMLLPLTLEMGSWAWVRKNPLQGLSTIGRFNPVKPHRLKRTLRRHLPLFDFLLHAAVGYQRWLP